MAQGQYSNIRDSSGGHSHSTQYGVRLLYLGTLFDLYSCTGRALQVVVLDLVQAHMRLKNWVDGGGVGITIRNEPRKTVITSIPISGGGVGNAAGYVKISLKF